MGIRRWDDAQERGSNGGEGMRGTTRAALMACGNTDQRSRTGGLEKKVRVVESEEKVNGLQLVEGKNVRGSLRKKRGAKGVRSHTSPKLTSQPVEGPGASRRKTDRMEKERVMKRGNRGIQGSGAGTGRVYTEEITSEKGRGSEGMEKAVKYHFLLQAPVEATFKCASVLSGCRIT